MEEASAWIGRTAVAEDAITPQQAALMAATLGGLADDRLAEGAPLPPLWHWMGWPDRTPMEGLGPDGHPARGGFLPPVPLPRRMWAGGRITFLAPLPIGARLMRHSQVVAVRDRTARAGRVVFVTVRHEVHDRATLTQVLHEEHDIAFVARAEVYQPPQPVPAPAGRLWQHHEACDPVRLFRYSALTFNAHRIHYDLEHTTKAEGYPGLLVHGPLQAALLMQAARRNAPGRQPAAFRFRAVRPVFHTDSLTIAGWPEADSPAHDPFATLQPEGHGLWPAQPLASLNGDGLICMQAYVAWKP
jgi:3-methylfumaryl-CoA hydratase